VPPWPRPRKRDRAGGATRADFPIVTSSTATGSAIIVGEVGGDPNADKYAIITTYTEFRFNHGSATRTSVAGAAAPGCPDASRVTVARGTDITCQPGFFLRQPRELPPRGRPHRRRTPGAVSVEADDRRVQAPASAAANSRFATRDSRTPARQPRPVPLPCDSEAVSQGVATRSAVAWRGRQNQDMDAVVEHVLEAARRGDWEAVGLALHPYLHWVGADGATLRGRKKVLAMLAQAPVPEPPSSVELRDGQVYRWFR
jgi:hypothetical protein